MSAVAGTVATPWQYAENLESVAVAALAGTQGGPIGFHFVDHEVTAVDCEMLVVLLGPITLRTVDRSSELGAGHASTNGWLNMVTFKILVARECIPTSDDNGNPPSAFERSTAMKMCAEDVWAIWHAIILAHGAGELFAGPCLEVFMDGAVPLPVSGMTAGWTITLRAAVPGYVPA